MFLRLQSLFIEKEQDLDSQNSTPHFWGGALHSTQGHNRMGIVDRPSSRGPVGNGKKFASHAIHAKIQVARETTERKSGRDSVQDTATDFDAGDIELGPTGPFSPTSAHSVLDAYTSKRGGDLDEREAQLQISRLGRHD